MVGNEGQVKDSVVPVFVWSWVDYSSKYGLAFKLSDKTVGVYFNDRSVVF